MQQTSFKKETNNRRDLQRSTKRHIHQRFMDLYHTENRLWEEDKKNWNATCKQWDLESSAYNKFSKRIDVYLGRHEILNRKKAKQEQKNYSLEIDVAIHSVFDSFFLCWQAFLLSSAVIFIFLFNLFTAEWIHFLYIYK